MSMTKTTPTPRVRALNLYTVESNGQPVAQAMAISQAEAVRQYVESQQQPVLSARLSSPLEARSLAGLPLLQRDPSAVDTKTADLFEATPAADHVEGILAMVEPLAAGGFSPCGRSLGDCGKATQTCGRDGCGVEVVEMPPQPAMHLHRFLALGDEEPAAEQPGELAEPVALAASAPAGVALGSSESGAADAPADSELKQQAEAAAARRAMGGKPVALYLDPATGQTWSGRGLKPKWLLAAIEAGRTQDEFLIDPNGAQE
jgi:hypothetical protein